MSENPRDDNAPPIAYTVRATLPDRDTAARFLAWLRDEHLRDLLDAGATRAEAVLLDPPEDAGAAAARPVVESRYIFPSRAAFARYLADHAPRLRGRGLELFPPPGEGEDESRRIVFERSVGEVFGPTR